jgi:hypothetical protein
MLSTREYSLLESESKLILFVFALFPDVLGETLAEKGFCASREEWKISYFFWRFKVRST